MMEEAARGSLTITSLAEESRPPASSPTSRTSGRRALAHLLDQPAVPVRVAEGHESAAGRRAPDVEALGLPGLAEVKRLAEFDALGLTAP